MCHRPHNSGPRSSPHWIHQVVSRWEAQMTLNGLCHLAGCQHKNSVVKKTSESVLGLLDQCPAGTGQVGKDLIEGEQTGALSARQDHGRQTGRARSLYDHSKTAGKAADRSNEKPERS